MASRSRKVSSAPTSIQETLAKTRIALDLQSEIEQREIESKSKSKSKRRSKAVAPEKVKPEKFNVIIEFDRSFPGGIAAARLLLLNAYRKVKEVDAVSKARLASLAAFCPQSAIDDANLVKAFGTDDELDISKSLWTDNYAFGALSKETIGSLSSWSILVAKKPVFLIYKIWLDQKLHRYVYESRRTVKCDAAFASFAADGKDIVWAVADTGIDGKHPHFKTLKTLILPESLMHMDFTQHYPGVEASNEAALTDQDGHRGHDMPESQSTWFSGH